jgi:hypothetical protein
LANYYYTIASLPFLSLEGGLSLEVEEFLQRCKEDMTQREYENLLAVKLDISYLKERDIPEQLKGWFSFENSLRNELVRSRAAERGWDESSYLREGVEETGIDEIVREAFAQSNPLQSEEVLLRARWNKLEELEVAHYFDFQRLAVLYLKLQLLERKSRFDLESGKQRFEEIYTDVREAITAASSTTNGES